MPRGEVMRQMLEGDNLGLIATKQTRDKWDIHVTKHVMGHKSLAAYDINSLFPFYLSDVACAQRTLHDWNEGQRRPNLSPTFIEDVSQKLKLSFIPDSQGDLDHTFGPEDVFHYSYAVLHSPTYRRHYAEFLKIDFPRLPLTSNLDLFRALCKLGEVLVGLHLMKRHGPTLTRYPIAGDNTVENVRYSEPGTEGETGRVYINKHQYFEGVPQEVWSFHIGGYQVCLKWLKDRKGRLLTYDDLTHYQRIVAALSETIRLMSKIDAVIEAHDTWPIK